MSSTVKKQTKRLTKTPLKQTKTLEQEAQEFLSKSTDKDPPFSAGDLYAGCALAGLIASGKYLRSEEIVEEAFSYRDRMLHQKKKTDDT